MASLKTRRKRASEKIQRNWMRDMNKLLVMAKAARFQFQESEIALRAIQISRGIRRSRR